MSKDARTCPSCGKKADPECSICPNCGAALGAVQRRAAPERQTDGPGGQDGEWNWRRLSTRGEAGPDAAASEDGESGEEAESGGKRPAAAGPSPKSRGTVGLLCLLFGIFGVHRFYAGRPVSGFFQLLTFGGAGFWSFIDLVLCILGKFKDGNGLRIER